MVCISYNNRDRKLNSSTTAITMAMTDIPSRHENGANKGGKNIADFENNGLEVDIGRSNKAFDSNGGKKHQIHSKLD